MCDPCSRSKGIFMSVIAQQKGLLNVLMDFCEANPTVEIGLRVFPIGGQFNIFAGQ